MNTSPWTYACASAPLTAGPAGPGAPRSPSFPGAPCVGRWERAFRQICQFYCIAKKQHNVENNMKSEQSGTALTAAPVAPIAPLSPVFPASP